MAFRPFEFFRRRQKLFLAVMAIGAMFLFVVGDALMGVRSGGGGMLGRLFGVFRTPRDRVAVVAGSNINFAALQELAMQRRKAFALVQQVRSAGQDALLRKAGMTDAQFRLRESPNADERRRYSDLLAALEKENPELATARQAPRDSLSLEAVSELGIWDLRMAYARQGLLAAPSMDDYPLGANSLVQWLWWRRKADELGITFSNSKVKDDLLRAAGAIKLKGEEIKVTEDELPGIVRRAKLGADFDTLLGWLGDELRVMVAKGTVLGQPRQASFGRTGPLSIQATPLDLWNAYVDVRTKLEVGILPIQVNQPAFLSQVPEPTTEQIKEFYSKYRSQFPDPERDTPGFSIPKLYKVEFVYADLDPTADAGKYYHEWARTFQALDPVTFFGEAVEFYNKNKATRYRLVDPFVVAVAGTKPEDATYYRSPLLSPTGPWLSPAASEQAAAAQYTLGVSGVLASAPAVPLGFGPALSPVGKVIPRQQEQSLELAALVGDVTATASLGVGAAGLLGYPPRLGYFEKYQPLDQAMGGIVDELTETRAHQLLEQDLAKLKADLAAYSETYRKEYAKFRSRPGFRSDSGAKFTPPPFTFRKDGKDVSEPVETYLKQFAEARGLKYEGMKELRSRPDLFKEKDATPLGSILKPLFFATSMAVGRDFNNLVAEQLTDATSLFQAKRVPDELQVLQRGLKPRKYALFWKPEEKESRTPPLAECQAQVVEAWKLMQARELADAAAKALAEKAQQEGADGYRLLRDSKEGEYAEKTVAHFESSALGVGVLNYRAATIPTVESPPAGFLDDVLKTLQEPGQTMVVANQPKSIYYVLFLRERKQPRANDPLAIREFDIQVIVPSARQQLQVNNIPISEWVLGQQHAKYYKDWEKYFKDVTQYNQELAEQFKVSDRP